MLAFIGGGGQHGFGDLVGIGLEVLVEALDSAGIDELTEEGAGPAEEDVGQIIGVAAHHRGLDLGLVGLVLEGLHLDLHAGVRGLVVGDGLQVGGTVGVGLGGDAPQLQNSFSAVGLPVGLRGGPAAGSQGEDHAESEEKGKNLFHGYPPFLL